MSEGKRGRSVLRLASVLLAVLMLLPLFAAVQPAKAATASYRMPFDTTTNTKRSQKFKAYLGTYGGVKYDGYHNAEDWTGLKDNKVFAVADGEVAVVKNLKNLGYEIIIKHGDFWAEYTHVVPSVKKGDKVKVGQQIAVLATKSNTTNFSLATHLHWGIRAPLNKWSTSKNWYTGAKSSGYYPSTKSLDDQGYVDPSTFIANKQKANMVSVEAGLYSIRSSSGSYLNAGSDKDGGAVTTAAKAVTTKQEFTIQKTGSAYYLVAKASPTNRVLNVYSDNKSAAGMKVTLYKQTGDANQKWVFEQSGDAYIFHPSDNMDVALAAGSDGSLTLAKNSGAANQLWYLDVPVTVEDQLNKEAEQEEDTDPIDPPVFIDEPDPTPVDSIALTAVITGVGVKFDWTPSGNPLGYRIYRSSYPDGGGISITDFPITDSEYVDVNVEEYTTYYYTIREVLAEASFDPDTMELTSEELGPVSEPLQVDIEELITEKTVTKHFILMQIGKDTMRVDEEILEIDPGRGTAPVVESGRTLVPIRAIIETMEGQVGWDGDTREITLDANGHNVIMRVDVKDLTVDGEAQTMDVAPAIMNERTMLPLRFVAENIGCQIEWIGSTRQIIIVFYLEEVAE